MNHNAYSTPEIGGLLSPLQEFLDDAVVSAIFINKPQELFAERDGHTHRFDVPALTSPYLRRLFQWIANENGQVLSAESPILSGNLHDGSQVQLIIPQASYYQTMSIRKFTTCNLSFEDYTTNSFFNHDLSEPRLLQSETVDMAPIPNVCMSTVPLLSSHSLDTEQHLHNLYQEKNWQAFIQKAIVAKKNILISGSAASGKTAFLNSCLHLIPDHERLIILEDTYELKTPHTNTVRLKTVQQTSIHRQHLVQVASLLCPDRIIQGEIKGREVVDFISACRTTHRGALATIQANNPRVAFMRMAQCYQLHPAGKMKEEDIFKTLYEAIDIVLQLQKTDSGSQLIEVYYKEAR